MTALNYSSGISNADTTAFRAWGLELSNALTTVGFIKSADTGQVDWTTVTLPSAGNYVYEIRYLNDSLHGSKPCYCKLEYGNGSENKPIMRVTCGSSTDGAGTITGTTYLSLTSIITTAPSTPSASNFFTAVCSIDGYFGLAFKRGAFFNGPAYPAIFFITRTCDSSGTPTTDGFNFYYPSLNTIQRNTYISSSVSDSNAYACMYGGETSTLVGSDAQVARHFSRNPSVEVVPYLLSALNDEIGDQSTFTLTPVGVTPRTYLMLGGTNGPSSCGLGTGVNSSALRICMVYE